MPGKPTQKQHYTDLNKRLDKYCILVQSLFGKCNEKAANAAVSTGYSIESGVPFLFADFPTAKARIDKAIKAYARDMERLITTGMRKEWERANVIQDRFADESLSYYYKNKGGNRTRQYYRRNERALEAFAQRKDRGMTLSGKIWNLSDNYRRGIEKTISVALEMGTDAKTLAKQLTKYLRNTKEVNREYKRLYGVDGGVENIDYRAMRLARSEINMAYRLAERNRWNQFDFVVGYEIRTNGGAGCKGICEELAGVYPRDFFWLGWHPSCRCYEVPIMKSLTGFINGEGESIDEFPDNYADWLDENEKKIIDSPSLPYHIRDNYNDFENEGIVHECRKRKYYELCENPDYSDVELNSDYGLKATHAEHNFDKRGGLFELEVQEAGYRAGNEVIFEKEKDGKLGQRFTEGTWNGKNFEVAGCETATSNNILHGLSHCASKRTTQVCVIDFPNGGFDKKTLERSLRRYKGLRKNNNEQYIEFERIICVQDGKIILDMPFP